jgi:K+-sensing histidine kinase KdpD
MLKLFLDAVLLLFLGALGIFAWIFWEENRRDKTFQRIAEYIRDAAARCDQLAEGCSNAKLRSGLESLSFDLTKKASEICPELADDPLSGAQSKSSARWYRIASEIEAPLMMVVECTVILVVIDYWLKLPPIGVTLAYFIPIAFIATRYSLAAAVCALVASVLLSGFIFFPPKFTVYFDEPRQLLELLIFSGIALVSIPIIAKYSADAPPR